MTGAGVRHGLRDTVGQMRLASSRRLSALVIAAAALVLAACGGGDGDGDADPGDLGGIIDDAREQVAEDRAAEGADGDNGDGPADGGAADAPAFGEFAALNVTVLGTDTATYVLDDLDLTWVGAGGCGGSNFGVSINAVEAGTGFTALQLSAQIDEDLGGGATGSFPVEEMTLLLVTDGDIAGARSYAGPGTMVIEAHETGGATSDPNARRMDLTIEGSLEAAGVDQVGTVEVLADVVWVMGCP
jgi:hypothetical protein